MHYTICLKLISSSAQVALPQHLPGLSNGVCIIINQSRKYTSEIVYYAIAAGHPVARAGQMLGEKQFAPSWI